MSYRFSKTRRPTDPDPDSNERDLPSPQASFPNSALLQDLSAEQEADRLSEGVTSSTPEALRREMGERLGADFSGVRFHNNAQSTEQADSIGARAFTKGNDIYFGEGGFSTEVAAHELVHTVQQGVVNGEVSQSVPEGSVQMWSWPWKKKRRQKPPLDPKYESVEDKRFKDMERLFRIQAGLSGGDPRLVSAADRKWFEDTMKKPDTTMIREILKRRDEKGVELMNYRRSLDENNPENKGGEELNYQARNSAAAFDMNIYDMLAQKAHSKGGPADFFYASVLNRKMRKKGTSAAVRDAYSLLRDRTYNRLQESPDQADERKQSYREMAEQAYKNPNMYVNYSSDREKLSKGWNLVGKNELDDVDVAGETTIRQDGLGPGEPASFSAARNEDKKASDFLGVNNQGAYDKWKADLKPEEEQALKDYTGNIDEGGFRDYNVPLRKQEPLPPLIQNRLGMINDAMNRFDLPGDLTLYRGSSPDLFGQLTDADKIRKYYVGRVVRDRGFVSTSAVQGKQFTNKMIQLKIRVPKGKGRGALISPFSRYPNENEFLLKNSSAFLVTDAYHSDIDDKIWVEMDLLT